MIDNRIISEAGGWNVSASAERSIRPPPEFIELVGLHPASIERQLGYFRDEPYVIFGYCPGGSEVIWKDGHSSGFGIGGWKTFLWEIAPVAARHGAFLGSEASAGTHVLWVNRHRGKVYAAPREIAEDRLARINGLPAPTKRCLCALLDCGSCPDHGCPHASDVGLAAPENTSDPAPQASHASELHERQVGGAT